MDDRRENIFADQFGHAARCRDVAGRERRKTGRIHIGDIPVKRYRLAIAVDKKYDPGGAFHTQPCQNSLQSLKLMFL
jgi:hypothetical protein